MPLDCNDVDGKTFLVEIVKQEEVPFLHCMRISCILYQNINIRRPTIITEMQR